MTVFKYFLKLAWSKKSILLIYLGIFMLISILSSGSVRQGSAGFVPSKPDIRIIQEDKGPLADSLAAYLRSQANEVDLQLSEDAAREAVFTAAVDSVIVIPAGFSEDFQNGRTALRVYSDDRQMEGALLTNTIQKYLMFLKADASLHGTADPARVAAALSVQSQVTLERPQSGNPIENVQAWFRYYFNFMTYILLSIFILVFGMIMSEFNEENVKRRNAIIPRSSSRFQINIIVAQLSIAAATTAIFLFVGFLIRGADAPNLNWPAHILNALSFMLAALALSFLINTITRRQTMHTALSTVLSLGTSFISGVFVPLALLSPAVLTAARFFPTYYYVRATEEILSGLPYLANLGIQLLFALLFLVLGLTITKVRQGEDLLPGLSLKKLARAGSHNL